MARYYYYKDIQNPHTGETIQVKAADKHSLGLKIQKQYERWEREKVRNERAEKKQLAFEKTEEAKADIEALNSILKATLAVDDKIDWVSLLDKRPYPGEKPTIEQFHQGSFSKSFSFIPALKRKAEEQAKNEEASYKKALAEYETKKAEWELEQKKHNSALARKKIAYEKGETDGVETYISMVLDRSNYPDVININEELIYDNKTTTLLIDLDMPSKESLPRVQAFRYIAARDAIEEKMITDKAFGVIQRYALSNYIANTARGF